jgi:RNA polymerase sigma-70 factor (ECF subfamily)
MSSPADVDDWSLLRRAARRDNAAFQTLYDRHAVSLLRFLESRMDSHDAEEVANTTWLKVVATPPQAEQHFRGWLFQVARGLMIDRFRSHKRRKEVTSEDQFPELTAREDLSPHHAARERDLRNCIEKLEQEFADVVRRFLMGIDHQTIAGELKVSIGTSHSRLSRAKPRLKECLEHKGWQE